jgi:SAM-dependent methyltransferase
MSLPVEVSDARLVPIYDALNEYSPDSEPAFYSWLASEVNASSIVDLGCGTGLITCLLAESGYEMIGIDPAPAMIEIAKRRDTENRVRWIVGDAAAVPAGECDLAIMTGHVAQFFLTDQEWIAALGALKGCLRAGGSLAFESRDPEAREWERWGSSSRVVEHPTAGEVEQWSEVQGEVDGIVSFSNHYVFRRTGEEVVSAGQLRFRSLSELSASLVSVDLHIDQLYGDWDRSPMGDATTEMIVVASAG